MGQSEILNLLNKNPDVWHSSSYIKKVLGYSNNSGLFTSLKRLSKFKEIEESECFVENRKRYKMYKVKR